MKMRTTLTLDEDVAARLDHLRQTEGTPMRDLVNRALRAGLEVLSREEGTAESTHYHIRPVDLSPRVLNLDDVASMMSLYEGEEWQ